MCDDCRELFDAVQSLDTWGKAIDDDDVGHEPLLALFVLLLFCCVANDPLDVVRWTFELLDETNAGSLSQEQLVSLFSLLSLHRQDSDACDRLARLAVEECGLSITASPTHDAAEDTTPATKDPPAKAIAYQSLLTWLALHPECLQALRQLHFRVQVELLPRPPTLKEQLDVLSVLADSLVSADNSRSGLNASDSVNSAALVVIERRHLLALIEHVCCCDSSNVEPLDHSAHVALCRLEAKLCDVAGSVAVSAAFWRVLHRWFFASNHAAADWMKLRVDVPGESPVHVRGALCDFGVRVGDDHEPFAIQR